MFVGVTSNAKELLSAAVERLTAALRPQTRIQYLRQFKVFMAFTIYTGTQSLNSRSTIITFLEFLARNALSYRVIMNYVSALKFHFCHYQIPTGVFEDYFVKRLLRGIQYSVPLVVRPKGLFSLSQIREIVRICDIFENSLTYRGAFLLAFYGLLRISNIAPASSKFFDPTKHLLRRDIRFAHPGVQITLKWAKNLQAPERTHVVKLPWVKDPIMCPVATLQAIFARFRPQPLDPVFTLDDYSILTQSDLRKRLSSCLRIMGLPLEGHGFHTFRRSGATLAYDANISLTAIKLHRVWNSDAIWSYISDDTNQALQVPLTFQKLVNSLQ